MPQRFTFNFPDPLHLEKGGDKSGLIVYLLAGIMIIVLFYYLTRPKENKQTIPYPSLIQQTYARNQVTQAIERLRGW